MVCALWTSFYKYFPAHIHKDSILYCLLKVEKFLPVTVGSLIHTESFFMYGAIIETTPLFVYF